MKNELKSFFKGFVYAFNGLLYGISHERNMRFHLCAALTVMGLSGFYDFSKAEKCALYLCIGGVIAAELLNTAIERAADEIDIKENKLVGIAKDCAAGAVLVMAAASVLCGVVLFGEQEVIRKIIEYYMNTPAALVGLIIWIIFSCVYVFAKRKD